MIPETKKPSIIAGIDYIFPTYEQDIGWNALRLQKAHTDYLHLKSQASFSVDKIYKHTLKLRSDDDLVVIADSASDLAALKAIVNEAKKTATSTSIFYLKDFHNDDLESVDCFLKDLPDEKTVLYYIDTLHDQEKAEFYEYFAKQQYDIGINLMNGSYDIRTRIGEIATNQMPVAEMPGIQITTLTQKVFQTKPEEMKPIGDELISILKNIEEFHFVHPTNGCEMTVKVDPQEPWINEANNGFSLRYKDFVAANFPVPNFVVDNLPMGEVYKNVKLGDSEGTWVLTQMDKDIWEWALRTGIINKKEMQQMFVNVKDPVKIIMHHGRIVDVQGGRRAKIFKQYLLAHNKKDANHEAIFFITEVAIGINFLALIPETGEITTLGGEKALFFHIAFGNSPVQDLSLTRQANIIHSDSHLDMILRDVYYVEATMRDGKRVRLFGPGGLLDRYGQDYVREQQEMLNINYPIIQ